MRWFIFFICGVAVAVSAEMATLRSGDICPDAASSTFGFYNDSPESPDGQKILYMKFDKTPESRRAITPGSLWVYREGWGSRQKISDLYGVSSHNGAMARWIDNDLIVWQDGKLRPISKPPEYTTYHEDIPSDQINVFSLEDGLKRTLDIQARLGHGSFGDLFPVSVMHPVNGYHGVYLVNARTGESRLVCSPELFDSVVPDEFKRDHESASKWRLLHASISPDGAQLMMRLDVFPMLGVEAPVWNLFVVVQADGTHPQCLGDKPLHSSWYDAETIAGHAGYSAEIGMEDHPGKMAGHPLMAGTENRGGVYRFRINPPQRIEWLAPMGNHLGISSDGEWFVSENWYQQDTVVMRLYHKYINRPVAELMRSPYGARYWGGAIHVNPSFSRDGRRVYFTEVIDGHRYQARWVDIGPVLDLWAQGESHTLFKRENEMTGTAKKTVSVIAGSLMLTGAVQAGPAVRVSEVVTAKNGTVYSPDFAIDGDLKTAWATRTVGGWLQLDLEKETEISTVSIAWEGAHGRRYDFKIEASTDGETWTEVFARVHNGKQKQLKAYKLKDSVTARYIRVTVNGYSTKDGTSGTWAYIAELEVN